MCGRFFLTVTAVELSEAFAANVPFDIPPSYNIAPTQNVVIIPNTTDREAMMAHWSLIPKWAKEPKLKYPTFNARSETAHEKNSFKGSFKRRRCLIPVSGFYEWMKVPGESRKQPYVIQMESQEPFAFAGLWEIWHEGDEDQLVSTTILTTEPNSLVEKIHNRMPVILHSEDYAEWLDPAEKSNDDLKHIFKPFPAAEMMTYPVSKEVGKPQNNYAELLDPIQIS